jgi:uncharacterized membrane protein
MTDLGLRRGSLILCSVGIGIAGYLTYVHYAGLQPICGISHGCETVQTSRYASLVGVPVALLGLISYLLIFASLCVRDDRSQLAGYALVVTAFVFSAYLTYREVFTIHAICTWCVSSAIVFTLLMIVETLRVRHSGRAEAVADGALA